MIEFIGWSSHDKNLIKTNGIPDILTCRMLSDTPISITGHADLLSSDEIPKTLEI